MKAEATFSLTGKSYLYYDLGVNFFDTANVYSFGTSASMPAVPKTASLDEPTRERLAADWIEALDAYSIL